MKKIISLVLINVVFISTSFAWNTDNLSILSNWDKVVNNMNCNYLEVDDDNSTISKWSIVDFLNNKELVYKKGDWNYSSYNIETKENKSLVWYIENKQNKRAIDFKKVKESSFWTNSTNIYGENWEFEWLDNYLKQKEEYYNNNSYAFDIYKTAKMTWDYLIYKDWKYIYNAEKPVYYKDWSFWFSYTPFQASNYFIFFWCKEVISFDYQTKLNKTLNNLFLSIELKFKNDDEKRLKYYEDLESKINTLLSKNNSIKNTSILKYIKGSITFYKNNWDEYGIFDDWINWVWISDFKN